jgi:hypothetical protein
MKLVYLIVLLGFISSCIATRKSITVQPQAPMLFDGGFQLPHSTVSSANFIMLHDTVNNKTVFVMQSNTLSNKVTYTDADTSSLRLTAQNRLDTAILLFFYIKNNMIKPTKANLDVASSPISLSLPYSYKYKKMIWDTYHVCHFRYLGKQWKGGIRTCNNILYSIGVDDIGALYSHPRSSKHVKPL